MSAKQERSRDASPIRRSRPNYAKQCLVLQLVIQHGQLEMDELLNLFETCKLAQQQFTDFYVTANSGRRCITFRIESVQRWNLLRFVVRHRHLWHHRAFPSTNRQEIFDNYVETEMEVGLEPTPLFDPLSAPSILFYDFLELAVKQRSLLLLEFLLTRGNERQGPIVYKEYIFIWRRLSSDRLLEARKLAVQWAHPPALELVNWFLQDYNEEKREFTYDALPLPTGLEYEL